MSKYHPPSSWDRRGCGDMCLPAFHGQSHMEFPRGPCQSPSMSSGFRPGVGETCVHARKDYEMGSARIWTSLPGRFWVFALWSSPSATSQCSWDPGSLGEQLEHILGVRDLRDYTEFATKSMSARSWQMQTQVHSSVNGHTMNRAKPNPK